jgi:hypothetical protein
MSLWQRWSNRFAAATLPVLQPRPRSKFNLGQFAASGLRQIAHFGD